MNPLFSLIPAIIGSVTDSRHGVETNESIDTIGESYSAKHAAQRAENRVKILEANLAKTMMICEALWELLAAKTNLTEQDLYQKILDVDLRDGVQDNQNRRKAVKCPKCDRTVSGRHPACLYCGQAIDTSAFTL